MVCPHALWELQIVLRADGRAATVADPVGPPTETRSAHPHPGRRRAPFVLRKSRLEVSCSHPRETSVRLSSFFDGAVNLRRTQLCFRSLQGLWREACMCFPAP